MGLGGRVRAGLKWLLPEPCAGCGALGCTVCDNCLTAVNLVPRLIPHSGKCSCITYYAPYKDEVKQLLTTGKFNGDQTILNHIGAKLGVAAAHFQLECDLVIPIPIHKKRLKTRGFNQVDLLFQESVTRSGLTLYHGLERTHNTTPLYELSSEERNAVIEGKLIVLHPEKIIGKRVLLLDDIFTSGATLNVAAKALFEAGATQVSAHVLCYSKPDEKRVHHRPTQPPDPPRLN